MMLRLSSLLLAVAYVGAVSDACASAGTCGKSESAALLQQRREDTKAVVETGAEQESKDEEEERQNTTTTFTMLGNIKGAKVGNLDKANSEVYFEVPVGSHLKFKQTTGYKMAGSNDTGVFDSDDGKRHLELVDETTRSNESRWRGCLGHGAKCWIDRQCCGEMKCLGIKNWQCGYSPGRAGEYCNAYYHCAKHLLCHHGKCTDYKDVLLKGSEGRCRVGSPSGKIKVMTYNLFLIKCLLPGQRGGSILTCQPEKDQLVRIQKLMQWIKQRDEDVVVVQELFNLQKEVMDGMAAAGFCHYVTAPFAHGSLPKLPNDGPGLAIFSKYPIQTVDFIDWFDWFGEKEGRLLDPEAFADKGLMYAKILKDSDNYHIFNTHTQSNSLREHHDTRVGQFVKIRDFAEEVTGVTPSELILFGGDFNEDKYLHGNKQKFYKEMIEELHAVEPKVIGDLQHSLDTKENPMLANLWAGTSTATFRELLDYVFVSTRGTQPINSHCEILRPQWPLDCSTAECMLSDHFPNTCTFEVRHAQDAS